MKLPKERVVDAIRMKVAGFEVMLRRDYLDEEGEPLILRTDMVEEFIVALRETAAEGDGYISCDKKERKMESSGVNIYRFING